LNKIDNRLLAEEVKEMVYELFLIWEPMMSSSILRSSMLSLVRGLQAYQEEISPLLDTFLRVPAAVHDATLPLRAQPFNLGYDFVGRLAIARIYEGKMKVNDQVLIRNASGKNENGRIVKLFTFRGLERVETEVAEAGDIVMIAGLAGIDIGDTIGVSPDQELLPIIAIDEPTISLNFLVNDSPFAGREGKFVTNRQIKERLEKELEVNVGL
jgi:GTP-binding protein